LTSALAPAKLNLALVVGPRRADGKHEVASVMQPLALADEIELRLADQFSVDGFPEDTLVRDGLELLARVGGTEHRWSVSIRKRIAVAAGLGGGSSDVATALRLANDTLTQPFPPARLHELAASLGADVPFFLTPGPKLAEGDGTELRPLALPQDYAVLLLLPSGTAKSSTASVYAAFDARGGEREFERRRAELERALASIRRAGDLAKLPPNDLVSSPLVRELEEAGAFRADATGAGPTLYGLFRDRAAAQKAARRLEHLGQVWVTEPAW
jgi:4-diphosphocytidyl-2-C-methyl-D-erythritol kinase